MRRNRVTRETALGYKQRQLLEFLKGLPNCTASLEDLLKFGHSPRAATLLESKGLVTVDHNKVHLVEVFDSDSE
jgi:hypothetical protein